MEAQRIMFKDAPLGTLFSFICTYGNGPVARGEPFKAVWQVIDRKGTKVARPNTAVGRVGRYQQKDFQYIVVLDDEMLFVRSMGDGKDRKQTIEEPKAHSH